MGKTKTFLCGLLAAAFSGYAQASVPRPASLQNASQEPSVLEQPVLSERPHLRNPDAEFLVGYLKDNIQPSEEGYYEFSYSLGQQERQLNYIPDGVDSLTYQSVSDIIILFADRGYVDFDKNGTVDQIIREENGENQSYPMNALTPESQQEAQRRYTHYLHAFRRDIEPPLYDAAALAQYIKKNGDFVHEEKFYGLNLRLREGHLVSEDAPKNPEDKEIVLIYTPDKNQLDVAVINGNAYTDFFLDDQLDAIGHLKEDKKGEFHLKRATAAPNKRAQYGYRKELFEIRAALDEGEKQNMSSSF